MTYLGDSDPMTDPMTAADFGLTDDQAEKLATDPAAPWNTDTTTTDTAPQPVDDDQTEPDGKVGAEAAKYRRRLRDAETQRDQLAARVERMQRADALRIASTSLAMPDDLFRFGLNLEDILDDDGNVDEDRVRTATAGLLAERPGLAKIAPRPAGPSAAGLGNRPGNNGGGKTWVDLLRDR